MRKHTPDSHADIHKLLRTGEVPTILTSAALVEVNGLFGLCVGATVHPPPSLVLNPFTAPACKVSGLKDARTRLQTVYLPVLPFNFDISFQ